MANKRLDTAVALALAHPFPNDLSMTKEQWCKLILDLADTLIEVEKETQQDLPVEKEDRQTYQKAIDEVLRLYNYVFSRSIGLSDQRVTNIINRIKEGKKYNRKLSASDFKKVFMYKKETWGDDPDKAGWIQLEQLTSRKNFFKYLEEADVYVNKFKRTDGPVARD